nr:flagellar hook-length control protein FliK [uncultured Amphritea sp.]
MNQTLSTTGVGSLLNVGSVSGSSTSVAETPSTGALSNSAARGISSFDQSMQQAQQRSVLAEQKQSGQPLPGGGRPLPTGMTQIKGASAEATGVQIVVDTVNDVMADAAEMSEQRLDLNRSLEEPSDRYPDATQLGDQTLQQIDQHRDAGVVVTADSALNGLVKKTDKTAGLGEAFSTDAMPFVGAANRAGDVAVVAESNGVMPKGVAPAISSEFQAALQKPIDSVSPMVAESRTGGDSKGKPANTLESDAFDARGAVDQTVQAEIEPGAVDGARLSDLTNQTAVRPTHDLAQAAASQIAQQTANQAAVQATAGQTAVTQVTVDVAGQVSGQPASGQAGQIIDPVTGQLVAQAGQSNAEHIRSSLKSSGGDKAASLELSGRSESRQEGSLTGFADSLAAASKSTRTAQESPQVMPQGVKPGTPSWGQAVNDRVMLMASKNGQFAEIQLDPPELGSLQVKLHLKNDQVSVVFTTPHGSVRESLEQNMPRLREMFADQGFNLSESSVEDQSGQQRDESQSGSASFAGYSNGSADEGQDESAVTESLSLVDYYA